MKGDCANTTYHLTACVSYLFYLNEYENSIYLLRKFQNQGNNQINEVETNTCNATDWTSKHNLMPTVLKSPKKDVESAKYVTIKWQIVNN